MTVKELISKLSEADPDLPVIFGDTWGQTWPVNDLVVDYLTNMETDEEVECLIFTEQDLSQTKLAVE